MSKSQEKHGCQEKGRSSELDRVYDSQDPLTAALENLTPEERKELGRRLNQEEEDRIGGERLAERYRSTQGQRAKFGPRRSVDAPPIFRKTDRGWVLNTAPPPPISHRIKAGLTGAFWFVVGSIVLGLLLWAAYTSFSNLYVTFAVLILVCFFWLGSKQN